MTRDAQILPLCQLPTVPDRGVFPMDYDRLLLAVIVRPEDSQASDDLSGVHGGQCLPGRDDRLLRHLYAGPVATGNR